MEFRAATLADYPSIAQLHTTNWRQHYRGLVNDHYLDNVVEKDRLDTWQKRLTNSSPNQNILLAIVDQKLGGFVCTYLDHKEGYPGAYLDNIHMESNLRGRGIGALLMKKTANWVYQQRPESPLFLWVLQGNASAKGFYDRLQGRAEPPVEKLLPWGERSPLVRYVWDDVKVLINM